MKKFNSIDEILDFAIQAEQDAIDFYKNLAERATTNDMKKAFEEFVQEEISHKALLVKVKEQGFVAEAVPKVNDLKVADYHVDISETADMDYEQALLVAMKKEKAAYKLYSCLADRAEVPKVKALFEKLANEEAKHKLKFETEYDEFVLREN